MLGFKNSYSIEKQLHKRM